MAQNRNHKLAEKFTVYSFDLNTTPPTRVEEGRMDLTSMDPNGKLDDGEYFEIDTSKTFKIKGKATDTGGFMQLSLKNKERPERWDGVLILDSGDGLQVAGLRIITSALAAQDEEPWLITKP